MFSRKLAKSMRERLRAERRENQLIEARAKEEISFIYVVNPPEIPRIAFGSGLERVTLPMSGPSLTPFMRKIQGEVREFPGPHEYNTTKDLIKKNASKYGNAPFVSKLPRLAQTATSAYPPVGTYHVHPPKKLKQAARPFNVGALQKPVEKFTTTGPANYAIDRQSPNMKICSAFGSKRIIWPAVAIICSPVNNAKCSKCSSTPIGDYYHQFKLNLDLCRSCMKKQLRILKRCTTDLYYRARMRNELNQYQRVRYCGFFHDHQGTTAAIQLMSKSTLKYKIRTENYLYTYHKL
ncbi:uncharacterized protein [Eurosta solidaginis]|uniref:uncharacterized protein n=1 Tax=Eurosta solidaginis TaxID=178769 RepID=UPI003531010A